MSAALMRKTLVEAGHHARHRGAFGARLFDQPLMRNVLADLALESEAATTLTLRLAGAADRAVRGDAGERVFRRIATAVGKYWVTKRDRPSPPRPWNASAATVTWRSPACPGTTARPPAVDLGGLGQRQRPRRAEGTDPRTRHRGRLLRRTRPGPRGGRPAGRGGDRAQVRTRPGHAGGGPPARGAHGPHPAGVPPGPARPARGRRRLLRDPARRRLGHSFGTLPDGADLGGILERALSPADG
ncbi:hypothetical protein L1856_10825 [Streptomyces sp. Tue 6430]|nr:hypothetical protein [Streptomyces sp. Tue 6430]